MKADEPEDMLCFPTDFNLAKRGKEASKINCQLFPWITGEQLQTLAYNSTSGDMLTTPGSHHHKGSPYRLDTNGHTKKEIHDSAINGDRNFFNKLATRLNSKEWPSLMTSTRIYVNPEGKGKKSRAIDLPSEAKRLLSMLLINNLEKLVSRVGWLEDSIIGFRSITDFKAFRRRKDSLTIQDAFADTVFKMLQNHGSWAVWIDLADAFGNFPHQAIHAAFKELGINHIERRQVVELVRVRTKLPSGKLFKPKNYGIEQGNPASPLVFNIVMSFICKQLKNDGIRMASYGDDIVLAATSESEAHEAFESFMKIATTLGFTNVRTLGSEGKSSRIINTLYDQLPLIKTYLLGRGTICLSPDKMCVLSARLSKKPTMKEIRAKNEYKIVSKESLKTIIDNGVLTLSAKGLDILPAPSGLAEVGVQESSSSRVSVAQDIDRSISLLDVPHKENESFSYLTKSFMKTNGDEITCLKASSPNDLLSSSSVSTYSADQQTVTNVEGGSQNGRMPVLRDGSEAGVTSGYKDVEMVGRRHSTSSPVLLTEDDMFLLKKGRRMRCKDQYRGCLLDLRELSRHVPPWLMPNAITQLCRVSSVHGKAHLLIHPGDPWVWDDKNFRELHRINSVYHPLGEVFILRKVPANLRKHPMPKQTQEPPDVEFIILSSRRQRNNTRIVNLNWESEEHVGSSPVKTCSTNPRIANFAAVANTIYRQNPKSVAFQATGLAETILLKNACPRQVTLESASQLLKQWKWQKDGSWLVGTH